IDRGNVHPIVTVRVSQSVHTVISMSPVAITGGTLTIGAASELDGGFTLTNGATLFLNGPLTTNGNFDWQNGEILGGAAITNGGTLTLSTTNTKILGVLLNNNATLVHQAGALQLDLFTQFSSFIGQLNNSGLYDIQGDVSFGRSSSTPSINNSGTFRKSSGTGSVTLGSVPLNNNGGVIDAEAGTLVVTGATHTGGTFSAGSTNGVQAILNLTGSHTFTGTYTGSGGGLVQLAGNRFTVGAAGASFNFPAGLLQ